MHLEGLFFIRGPPQGFSPTRNIYLEVLKPSIATSAPQQFFIQVLRLNDQSLGYSRKQ